MSVMPVVTHHIRRHTLLTEPLQYDCTLSSNSATAMATSCTIGFSLVHKLHANLDDIGAISGPSTSESSKREAWAWNAANEGNDVVADC